ncbi:peptidoglycan-binding protein [Nodosilinea sp. LEGE 07298]|uniref:peptidoglycan-binding domain-containing protein n=1 Tax=Nodosilinea sp. LEGE 07298 TaxID=2777970 RepID=UPI00187F53B5|nr:peptidoglycan-binding domain-containing protein [Nodosilinea sp. LEGE 07298]MBE9113404.1 peptidoglycan-binding protein [Nodosilinea sp. LEGE 07298]
MTTRWTTALRRSGLLSLGLSGLSMGFIALGSVQLAFVAPSLAQGAPRLIVQEVPTQPFLRPGDSGPQVSQLQRKLTDLGLYSGPVDGLYGANTAAAVRSLQQQQGTTADGIAGPQTWIALETALRQGELTLPTPLLRAKTLAFTPLVVAQPAPPPSALWLALMPLVPIAGGALTYLHRRLKHQQVFQRRRPRRRLPPKPPCSGKGP